MTDLPPLSKPESFFLETPLYTRFSATPEDADEVLTIRNPPPTLDSHCMRCDRDSVFHYDDKKSTGAVAPDILQYGPWKIEVLTNGNFWVQYNCTRCRRYSLLFLILISSETIQKYGQFPSLADLQLADVRKYRAVLPPEKYAEFTRAIGLAAHGVGIGSFVYLRRIFAFLVEEARQGAKGDDGLDEDNYQKLRMAERIEVLSDHLPPFLVEHKTIYGILSKGLHELTEQECLAHFEPLKVGIELILEERLERKEKDEKIRRASEAIQKITSQPEKSE